MKKKPKQAGDNWGHLLKTFNFPKQKSVLFGESHSKKLISPLNYFLYETSILQ